jgi:membrane-bound lytic murein transglycosylase D
LRDLYETFGDWNLALAAYNCGEARVSRAIRKAGHRNYWDLDLPRQTDEYVPCFMAAVTIGKNPEAYGFRREYDPPYETETVTLHRSYSLAQLSRASGVPVESLKQINPSLRKETTPPYRSGFDFYLPAGSRETFLARLDDLSREPEPATPDDVQVASSGYHRVRRGETLSKIAAKYGTSVASIAKANKLRSRSVIHTGQRLRIPGVSVAEAAENEPQTKARSSSKGSSSKASSTGTYTVRRGDTVAKIAARHGESVSSILKANGLSSRSRIYPGQKLKVRKPADVASSGSSGSSSRSSKGGDSIMTYTVRGGDTLWKIAKRFGTSVGSISSLNGLRNDSVIRPGDRIKIEKE